MNIGDVNIPISPLWKTLEDIATHCREITDMNGQIIYGDNVTVEREDSRPLPQIDETPYIKIRLEDCYAENRTVDMYAVQRHAIVAVDIYAFQTDPNSQLSYSRKIEDLVEWTLLSFSSPHIDEPAFPKGMDFFRTGWRDWDSPQMISIGKSNPVDITGRMLELPEGMVVRSIKLRFWTAGEIRPVNDISTN